MAPSSAMNSSSPEPCNKAEAVIRSHLPPYLPNREIDVYVVADGAEFPDLVKGGPLTRSCLVSVTAVRKAVHSGDENEFYSKAFRIC